MPTRALSKAAAKKEGVSRDNMSTCFFLTLSRKLEPLTRLGSPAEKNIVDKLPRQQSGPLLPSTSLLGRTVETPALQAGRGAQAARSRPKSRPNGHPCCPGKTAAAEAAMRQRQQHSSERCSGSPLPPPLVTHPLRRGCDASIRQVREIGAGLLGQTNLDLVASPRLPCTTPQPAHVGDIPVAEHRGW